MTLVFKPGLPQRTDTLQNTEDIWSPTSKPLTDLWSQGTSRYGSPLALALILLIEFLPSTEIEIKVSSSTLKILRNSKKGWEKTACPLCTTNQSEKIPTFQHAAHNIHLKWFKLQGTEWCHWAISSENYSKHAELSITLGKRTRITVMSTVIDAAGCLQGQVIENRLIAVLTAYPGLLEPSRSLCKWE